MIDCYNSRSINLDFDKELILKHLQCFEEQINIVNANYLSSHLKGKVSHKWITYRNSEQDWYSKDYIAVLDDEAISFCGIDNHNSYICVSGTLFWDEYIKDLLWSYTEYHKGELYTPDDENKCLKSLQNWKSRIKEDYDVIEHIKRLVWTLEKYFKNCNEQIEMMAKEFFSEYEVNFKEFNSKGLQLELLDYYTKDSYMRNYQTARVKHIHGLWGGYTSYGNKEIVLPNESTVTIPMYVYARGKGEIQVTEVGKGVFDNLSETKKIILPHSLIKIDWSFWRCRKLESIEVKEIQYQRKQFKSIDGVLYNADATELLAYPNMHGTIYEIPEGVKKIRKNAFKDCSNLEELILPSTLEHIGVNAFYRCENLKRIIVNKQKDSIEFEGFWGDYGNVNPRWYWLY